MTAALYWTAVANSFSVIWKHPSPARAITIWSGNRNLAAIAEGRPYPIEPEIGASWVLGFVNLNSLCPQTA